MDARKGSGFGRIACLSGEIAEILNRLGAGDRIVDLSGPRGASDPDLLLASQESIPEDASAFVRRGIPLRTFRPGSVEEVLRMIRELGEIAGAPERGVSLASELEEGLEEIRSRGEMLLRHPRVFFEEWPDPLTAGSPWVGELVEAAGGEDLFPEFRREKGGEGRIVDPAEVVRREPEVIIAAWRDRRVDLQSIRSRPGWEGVPAVRRGKIFGIEASLVLRPGPTSLGRGLAEIHRILAETSLG